MNTILGYIRDKTKSILKYITAYKMAGDETTNSGGESGDSLVPGVPITGETTQQKKAEQGKSDSGQIKQETNQPVYFHDVNHNKWGLVHTIALLSFIVNGALAWFTWRNLSEYKRQFGVLNNPSLAIGQISIPKREIGKPFAITYQILSLTKNPVHIYASKYCFSFDTLSRRDIRNEIISMKPINTNSFVMLEFPYTITKVLSYNLSKEDSTNLQYGFTTLMTEFEYYNTINDCWAVYIFAARLKIGPTNRIEEVYYNENRDTIFTPCRPTPR